MKESKQTSTENEWVSEWMSDDSACSYVYRAKVCEWINFMRNKISKKRIGKYSLLFAIVQNSLNFVFVPFFFRLVVGGVKICVYVPGWKSYITHETNYVMCDMPKYSFFSAGMAQYCSLVVW